MTKRALAIFTAVTGVLVILAFVTYEGTGPTGGAEPGERFFPELESRLDAVREIRVTYRGESFTIERAGTEWRVREHSGYPADTETVAGVLRGIAALRKFEPKTRVAERYGQLDVEEPTGDDSDSRLVTLIGEDGDELASIIIGKQNDTNQILGRELVYVRLPNDEQSWLAIGNPQIENESIAWTHQRLMDIDVQRMRRYRLTRPDGREVTVSRPGHSSASEWAIENVPEGREPKGPTVIAGPASALDPVDLRDVKPAGEVDFEANAAGTAVLQTFDGITVTATLAEEDDTVWVRFAVAFDESQALDGEPPEGSRLKSAEDARAEAEEISDRVDGWAYQLDTTSQRYLRFTLEDLLKEATEETPENEGGNGGGDGSEGTTNDAGTSGEGAE